MVKKANYSVKDEIEKALLTLLAKKEYTDITVTDIVKEANVARVSFYRHFSSISDVLDSIAEQTSQKFNIEIVPLIETTDERKLREFLFNYFYQISLNYKEMWALGMVNSDPISKRLSLKIQENSKTSESTELSMSEKYGWIAKLSVLDGIARKWVSDGLQETPEEMINYVMPLIQTF